MFVTIKTRKWTGLPAYTIIYRRGNNTYDFFVIQTNNLFDYFALSRSTLPNILILYCHHLCDLLPNKIAKIVSVVFFWCRYSGTFELLICIFFTKPYSKNALFKNWGEKMSNNTFTRISLSFFLTVFVLHLFKWTLILKIICIAFFIVSKKRS